ncbi:MAG: hypothetical protein R3E01_19840 [Pirellulaceae bacterium]
MTKMTMQEYVQLPPDVRMNLPASVLRGEQTLDEAMRQRRVAAEVAKRSVPQLSEDQKLLAHYKAELKKAVRAKDERRQHQYSDLVEAIETKLSKQAKIDDFAKSAGGRYMADFFNEQSKRLQERNAPPELLDQLHVEYELFMANATDSEETCSPVWMAAKAARDFCDERDRQYANEARTKAAQARAAADEAQAAADLAAAKVSVNQAQSQIDNS